MYQGTNAIMMPVIVTVLLGLVLLFGAYYARRSGRLQSRGGKLAAVALLAVLAALVWVGPGLFLATG
jgi:hypothetical protein